MPEKNFVDIVDEIRARDPRYRRQAYAFVLAALDVVVRDLDAPRHVSGQELLAGFVSLAREEFGPLAGAVLAEWGVRTSRDVGHLVFHLVEQGLLGRQESDRVEDFEGGIDVAAELEIGDGD